MDNIPIYSEIIANHVDDYYGRTLSDSKKKYISTVINVACNNTVSRRQRQQPDVPIDAIISYVYNEYITGLFGTSNNVFLEQLRDSKFDPNELIDLTATQFFPDLFKAEMMEINLRMDQKVERRHTTLYTCRRCKKRETVAQQIYIKMKADEAVSFDVECVNCGNRWIVT